MRRLLRLSASVVATIALVGAFAPGAAADGTVGYGPNDGYEPNNTVATAFDLGSQHELDMIRSVTIRPLGDVDYFAFNYDTLPSSIRDLTITIFNGGLQAPARQCINAELLTVTGTPMEEGALRPVPCNAGQEGHIQVRLPSSRRFLLKISRPEGVGDGAYAFGVSATATHDRFEGYMATLAGSGGDDLHRVAVTDPSLGMDREPIGQVAGASRAFVLGRHTDPRTRFIFESTNASGDWSVGWQLTNRGPREPGYSEPTRSTIFEETAVSRSLLAPVAGLVRRVSVDLDGKVVASECGPSVLTALCGTEPLPTPAPTPTVDPGATPTVPAPAPTPAPPGKLTGPSGPSTSAGGIDGLSLRISRTSAKRRQTVVFSGRVVLDPIPEGGALVVVEVRTGKKRWQPAANLRTSATGTFRWSHRFKTRGRFEFRARILNASEVPTALSSTGVARLKIR